MKKVLDDIKSQGGKATFLLPTLPSSINGKITRLSGTRVVIETTLDGDAVKFIAHPNNVVVVTK